MRRQLGSHLEILSGFNSVNCAVPSAADNVIVRSRNRATSKEEQSRSSVLQSIPGRAGDPWEWQNDRQLPTEEERWLEMRKRRWLCRARTRWAGASIHGRKSRL